MRVTFSGCARGAFSWDKYQAGMRHAELASNEKRTQDHCHYNNQTDSDRELWLHMLCLCLRQPITKPFDWKDFIFK